MLKTENKPTKQDYVDVMFEALKQFKKDDYTTINLMTTYIASQFDGLDQDDECVIRFMVNETFQSLKKDGYFKARKFNEFKLAKDVSNIRLSVEDQVVKNNQIVIKQEEISK